MAETKKTVDLEGLLKALSGIDKALKHPFTQAVILPALKGILPSLGVSPDDVKRIEKHVTDLRARRERAAARAARR
jgi:hypothetical protein